MADIKIRFDDGAGYERMMGVWSRSAGAIFLDWVKPGTGLRWIDIGCGNGAFTELIVEHCAPSEIQGVDPSEGQLAFARNRAGARPAKFQIGDAMALPFPDARFDIAVMALVLFFVPDAIKGVSEMRRVTRPNGTVAPYLWDMPGGGFPLQPIQDEMKTMGLPVVRPPSAEASRIEVLRRLWVDAGFEQVETREIAVQRTFADFDDLWSTIPASPSIAAALASVSHADIEQIKKRVRARLPADAAGRITYGARANAIKGRVPG